MHGRERCKRSLQSADWRAARNRAHMKQNEPETRPPIASSSKAPDLPPNKAALHSVHKKTHTERRLQLSRSQTLQTLHECAACCFIQVVLFSAYTVHLHKINHPNNKVTPPTNCCHSQQLTRLTLGNHQSQQLELGAQGEGRKQRGLCMRAQRCRSCPSPTELHSKKYHNGRHTSLHTKNILVTGF